MAQPPSSSYDDVLAMLLNHVQQEQPRSGSEVNDQVNEVNEALNKLEIIKRWSEDQPVVRDDETLRGARKTINDLKTARSILSCQLKTLKEFTDSIEATLRPFEFGKGIQSLPVELLKRIFEEVGASDELGLVCKRFREILKNTPRIWRKVSNAISDEDELDKFVLASGAVGLDVSFHVGEPDMTFNNRYDNCDLLETVETLLPERERWEALNLHMSARQSEDIDESLMEMADLLSNLDYPRLHSLCYEVSTNFKFRREINTTESFLHFYRSFTLPKLRKLEIANFVPVPFTAPALTSIRIELWNENGNVFNFGNLALFLSSVPKLEDFTLHLLSYEISSRVDVVPPVYLNSLTKLEMVVHAELCSAVTPFMEALHMPAVKKMQLELRHRHWIPELDWMGFFLCAQEYPALEELSIDVVLNVQDPPSLCIPFSKLPRLRSLSAHVPFELDFDNEQGDRKIPALKTIAIHSDSKAWVWFMRRLGAKLKRQGDLDGVEKVTILRRKWDAAKAEEIKGYFQGQQVEWKEDDHNYFDY